MKRVFGFIIASACVAALTAGSAASVRAQGQVPAGRSVEITESGEAITTPTAAAPQAVAPLGAPTAEAGEFTPGAPKPAPAESTAVTSGTMALLRRLEEAHKDLKTIHATFHQVRVDQTFMDKTESDGELWFRKPDRFRCDYADPQKMVNLIVDKALYIYVPELQQADYWQFDSDEQRDQQLHELLIGFGFKASDLVARYDIHSSEDETEPLAELRKAGMDPSTRALFIVTPRPAYAESCPFVTLKVFIDKTTMDPVRIWYQDQNYDANMTIELKKIELNVPIKDVLFDREKIFAPGTEIIDKRNQS
ncbi:MAG: outer-membrane lipoprotein carrier protein LolA [bacterium]|nr:outer-membrane lipoprotein carrier protein LolA [bacterium]